MALHLNETIVYIFIGKQYISDIAAMLRNETKSNSALSYFLLMI